MLRLCIGTKPRKQHCSFEGLYLWGLIKSVLAKGPWISSVSWTILTDLGWVVLFIYYFFIFAYVTIFCESFLASEVLQEVLARTDNEASTRPKKQSNYQWTFEIAIKMWELEIEFQPFKAWPWLRFSVLCPVHLRSVWRVTRTTYLTTSALWELRTKAGKGTPNTNFPFLIDSTLLHTSWLLGFDSILWRKDRHQLVIWMLDIGT